MSVRFQLWDFFVIIFCLFLLFLFFQLLVYHTYFSNNIKELCCHPCFISNYNYRKCSSITSNEKGEIICLIQIISCHWNFSIWTSYPSCYGTCTIMLLYWLCIGMKYNYRMLRNVFGMSSTPWHPMANSAMDVRPHSTIMNGTYQLCIGGVQTITS